MTSDRLTDDELERIRDLADDDIATVRDMRLVLAELERLHSWDGLMSLLDEHWPQDLYPTLDDDTARDPGARIVSLLRWVDRLRTQLRNSEQCAVRELQAQVRADEFEEEAARLRAENTAQAAQINAVGSIEPRQYTGLTTPTLLAEVSGWNDAVATMRAALGLVQDREGQADA